MKLVDKYRDKYLNIPCSVTLQKSYEDETRQDYEILDIAPPRLPPKRDRKLTIDDELWIIMPYKNFTPEQKFDKYRKILTKLKKKHEPPKEKPIVKNFQEFDMFAGLLPPIVEEKVDLRICLFKFINEDGIEEIGGKVFSRF